MPVYVTVAHIRCLFREAYQIVISHVLACCSEHNAIPKRNIRFTMDKNKNNVNEEKKTKGCMLTQGVQDSKKKS